MARKLKDENINIVRAELGTDAAQKGIFATVFAFFFNEATATVLQNTLAHLILFPLAAATDVVKTLLAAIDLFKARNKNLGTVAVLLIEAAKAILVGTAVVGGIVAAAAFAALAPILFTIALGGATLYGLGLTIFNGYKWATTPKNSPMREVYKENTKAYAKGTGLGAVLTTAVGIIMILKAPVVSTVLAVTAAVSAAAYGIWKAVKFFGTFKSNEAEMQSMNSDSTDEDSSINGNENQPLLQPAPAPIAASNDAVLGTSWHNYYDYKNRGAQVSFYGNDSQQKKNYLVEQIDAKITQLNDQIMQVNNSFFGGLEETKRRNKIEILTELKNIVENNNIKQVDYFSDFVTNNAKSLANYFEQHFSKAFKDAFQSFFKAKSDVQDIFEAVEEYLQPTPSMQTGLRANLA